MNKNIKYTKDIILEAVKTSISIHGVLDKLNLSKTGGNHSYIKSRIVFFKIDTSHFLGKGSNLNCSPINKKTPQQALVELPFGSAREKTKVLRRCLIEIGKEHKCEGTNCGISDKWLDKKITLQIHHIDGNGLNNKIDNLMFLCPNCHSQTENYGRKKERILNFCEHCKTPINKNRKKCRECFNNQGYKNIKINKEDNRIKTRKVTRPTKEELEHLINTTPMTKIGKMFNVSDNAVRKWAKYYNIELKNRQGFWTKEKYKKNAILE